MERCVETITTGRRSSDWRQRLDSKLLTYCANHDVKPDDAVELVSEFLQAAQSARLSRAEQRHRMRNEIQILMSSMRLRRRAMEKAGVECGSCIGQASAIANLNRMLDTEGAGLVDLSDQFARVVTAVREAFYLDDRVRIEVEAEAIRLPADTARTVILILNEALTNAVKHGCGDEGCTVRILLARTTPGEAELTVEDDGRGSAAPGSGGNGNGTTLVDALVAQVGGWVERVRSEKGFRLVCTFPLDRTS